MVNYEGKLSYEQYNIFPVLKRMGHNVKFYLLEHSCEASLFDAVTSFKPDVILYKPYGNNVRPETIGYITKDLGYFTIGLMGDDDKYIDLSLKYCGNVSLIATNFKPAIKEYEQRNQKAVWLPYAANEDLFKPSKLPKIYDCSFVGAIRPTRVFYLDKLSNAGVSIIVKGAGWKEDGSSVVDIMDYIDIVNQTKVNINISEDLLKDNKLITQVKGRDFEVPMCGGLLVTKDSDQIREFFNPNKEIVVYKDFNDFIDKVKYYIKHTKAREKIANAGRQRALKYHTYKIRMTELLKGALS